MPYERIISLFPSLAHSFSCILHISIFNRRDFATDCLSTIPRDAQYEFSSIFFFYRTVFESRLFAQSCVISERKPVFWLVYIHILFFILVLVRSVKYSSVERTNAIIFINYVCFYASVRYASSLTSNQIKNQTRTNVNKNV